MDYYNLEATQTFLVSLKAMITYAGKLLILRVADSHGQGLWELPGGLLEMDEALTDGLIREVREETGLAVSVGNLVVAWDNRFGAFTFRDGRTLNARFIFLAYLCTATAELITLSHEHDDFQWISPETLTQPNQINFAANTGEVIQYYVNSLKLSP